MKRMIAIACFSISAAVCLSACGGGEHWTPAAEFAIPDRVESALFVTPDAGIACGLEGAVYGTADGGATWTPGTNESMCLFGIEVLDDTHAWICGNDGDVRFSGDGGRTWERRASFGVSEPRHPRHLRFLDAFHGWIATDRQIARTSDGGATWTEAVLPEGHGPVLGIASPAPESVLVMGASMRIYKTVDGGASWETVATTLDPRGILYIESILGPQTVFRMDPAGHGVFGGVLRDERGNFAFILHRSTDGGRTWSESARIPVGMLASVQANRTGDILTFASSLNHKAVVYRLGA